MPDPIRWAAIAALALLQGLWLDRLYTVAHEAVHRKLLPGHPRLNEAVGSRNEEHRHPVAIGRGIGLCGCSGAWTRHRAAWRTSFSEAERPLVDPLSRSAR